MKIRNVLILLLCLLFVGNSFAQTPRPSVRTSWFETVQWILTGQETLSYKTLANPSLTGNLTFANGEYFSNYTDNELWATLNGTDSVLAQFIIKSIADSAYTADNDLINLVFESYDDSLGVTEWSFIKTKIDDVSDESEDASLLFYTMAAGTSTLGLTITGDDVTIAGNLFESYTAYSAGAGALPVTTDCIFLTTGGAEALTLADGVIGQKLTIIMVSDGGDGTVTPNAFGNGTTITFDNNDSVVLRFDGTSWWVVGTTTAAVA